MHRVLSELCFFLEVLESLLLASLCSSWALASFGWQQHDFHLYCPRLPLVSSICPSSKTQGTDLRTSLTQYAHILDL